MSYRNKTYVIFDGDNDMWAYGYMMGWIENDKVDFNFYNAHDLRPLAETSMEETVKRRLRERMANAKQVLVLIGEKTKNLYRFVRWEIELAMEQDLPIIAVNLNGKRQLDPDLCPPLMKGKYIVHVPFKAKIIKHALDNFPVSHSNRKPTDGGDRFYKDEVYQKLGLNT